MSRNRGKLWRLLALGTVGMLGLAACGGASAGSNSGGGAAAAGNGNSSASSKKPIVIGASLSLTGDFASNGQGFKRGYELWAAHVNATGGLLGRPVKLDILNDASKPTQVVTNYQKLISSDHVALTFGPFSTALTVPSSKIAERYHYAFIEGAGGGPKVFAQGLHNVFDVSLPVADALLPFAHWIASMPASKRPKTAAYPTSNDPFTAPQIHLVQHILQKAGVRTVYAKTFPAEVSQYPPIADQVARSKAQVVVLGSIAVSGVSAFMQAFEQQHYNPKAFIAAAGPDQGKPFVKAVGKSNTEGVMVPNGWYPGYKNAASKAMVKAYLAKYGGSASQISSNVAEAYSVGQVAAQAVKATHGLNNQKIMSYLHSGVTLHSVQGPVKFNAKGENTKAVAFAFQWQHGKYTQVLPASAPGSSKVEYPKPSWGSG